MRFGDVTALGNVDILAPGQSYSEPQSTVFCACVQECAGKAHEDSHKAAKELGAKHGTPADET